VTFDGTMNPMDNHASNPDPFLLAGSMVMTG